MARIRLACPCSWVFFVADDHAGQKIKCPSCQKEILVPVPRGMRGPKPGAMDPNKKTLIACGAAFALLVLIAVVVLLSGGSKEEPAPAEEKKPVAKKKEDPTPKEPAPKTGTVDPKPRDEVDHHRRIDERIYLLNVAGLLSELLRHRGDRTKLEELQRRAREFLREHDESVELLGRRGESHFKAEFMRPGDTLLFLDGAELRDDAPDHAVRILTSFVQQNLREHAFCDVTVLRDGRRQNILMYFAWLPAGVPELVTYADLPPAARTSTDPGTTTSTTKPADERSKLPASLVADVRLRTKSLHPYYLATLPVEDRERMAALLKTGEGTPADEEFLRNRILHDFLPDIEAEIHAFTDQCKDLEAGLQTSKADVVFLKDGSRKEGTITEETGDFLRLEMKFGNNKASVKYAKSDIAKIERGKGVSADFPDRLRKAEGDTRAFSELFQYCKDNDLTTHADFVAYRILLLEPDHAGSRQHLGFARDTAGRWRREDAVETEAGKYKYQGKWYTPEELDKKLASAGYVKREGLWYGKKNWSYTLDNLYKDLSKFDHNFQNAAMLDMVESTKDVVYDIAKKEWVKKDKKVILGRFLGPNGIRELGGGRFERREGRVTIRITPPGPIVRCRVKAPGQVTEVGAGIVVRAFAGDDRVGQVLYRLSGKDSNEKTHEVAPASLQGCATVTIEAQMYSAWTKDSSGDAMFLPCTREDRETFKVSCEILTPADPINKMLGVGRSTPTTPHEGASTDDQATLAAIHALAPEVQRAKGSFGAALLEMQVRTSQLKYHGKVHTPSEYFEILSLVGNLLTFQPDKMTEEAAQRTATWWARLSTADKTAFLEYAGLACAAERGKGVK